MDLSSRYLLEGESATLSFVFGARLSLLSLFALCENKATARPDGARRRLLELRSGTGGRYVPAAYGDAEGTLTRSGAGQA